MDSSGFMVDTEIKFLSLFLLLLRVGIMTEPVSDFSNNSLTYNRHINAFMSACDPF